MNSSEGFWNIRNIVTTQQKGRREPFAPLSGKFAEQIGVETLTIHRKSAGPDQEPTGKLAFWRDFLLPPQKSGEWLRNISYFLILALTVIATALRFVALEQAPPGFYLDEAANAANLICVSETGRDHTGSFLPLFAPALGGGFTSAPYLYLGARWVALFGAEIGSLRALSALLSTLTVIGVYLLTKALAGHSAGIFAALCASISPWSFQFARIAWDPPIMPCAMIWGSYLLMRPGYRAATGAGVLMALAVYSYPPARVAVPLLIPVLMVVAFRIAPFKANHTLFRAVCLLLPLLLLCIPLIRLTLSGEIQGRFNFVSIFAPHTGKFEYWPLEFGYNLIRHFDLNYLLFTGDRNLRHSTGEFGILSWVEALAIPIAALTLISSRRFRPSRAVAISLAGILSGIAPAALTWEGVPHALRSIGAQPFWAILAGVALAHLHSRASIVCYYCALLAVSFSVWYFPYYFRSYPLISRGWFNSDFVDQVRVFDQAHPDPAEWRLFDPIAAKQPQLVSRYYKMAYGGVACHNH